MPRHGCVDIAVGMIMPVRRLPLSSVIYNVTATPTPHTCRAGKGHRHRCRHGCKHGVVEYRCGSRSFVKPSYLQRALRFNGEDVVLWIEYLRLEMLYAAKLRKRFEVSRPHRYLRATRSTISAVAQIPGCGAQLRRGRFKAGDYCSIYGRMSAIVYGIAILQLGDAVYGHIGETTSSGRHHGADHPTIYGQLALLGPPGPSWPDGPMGRFIFR